MSLQIPRNLRLKKTGHKDTGLKKTGHKINNKSRPCSIKSGHTNFYYVVDEEKLTIGYINFVRYTADGFKYVKVLELILNNEILIDCRMAYRDSYRLFFLQMQKEDVHYGYLCNRRFKVCIADFSIITLERFYESDFEMIKYYFKLDNNRSIIYYMIKDFTGSLVGIVKFHRTDSSGTVRRNGIVLSEQGKKIRGIYSITKRKLQEKLLGDGFIRCIIANKMVNLLDLLSYENINIRNNGTMSRVNSLLPKMGNKKMDYSILEKKRYNICLVKLNDRIIGVIVWSATKLTDINIIDIGIVEVHMLPNICNIRRVAEDGLDKNICLLNPEIIA